MPDLSAAQLIIGFLLLLTPVVFFHELGHYWVARRAGVVVEVFSVVLIIVSFFAVWVLLFSAEGTALLVKAIDFESC